MIDLTKLECYRENNRIEAKNALGGLPESIWETYSAFANSEGGVILLGVAENKDKSLQAIDLPDPTWLITDFWEILTNPEKVSCNILTEENVKRRMVDGKHIIVIEMPPAAPEDRPVYIGGDPLMGTYRRDGEGDYRCSPAEVREMLRRKK